MFESLHYLKSNTFFFKNNEIKVFTRDIMVLNIHDESLITLDTNYKTFLFDTDFQSVLPEIFLMATAIFLLVYGVIWSTSKEKNYPLLLTPLSWLALLACLFTFVLLLNSPIQNALVFYNTLVIDDFTTFIKGLLLLSSFFCIFMSRDYMKQESLNAFEYLILILLSTSSMLFLVSSADFISLYLALEAQSLCFYVLAALKRNSEF